MPCYSPLQGFRSRFVSPSGKRPVVFNSKEGYPDLPVTLPCGQCIGCRLERSRQWAIRCLHEADLHENNCFITLTFSPENLPENGSLDVRHFQLFMKRLRKRFGSGIRFYHCGEYGEKTRRPHYHAILFNLDFPDKYLWKVSNGYKLYRSPILEELWPYGHSSVGNVTFESAAYVARYIMKKVTGKNAPLHYALVDYESGEITGNLKPDYTTMSRRPGIAKDWFAKFMTDVYPLDEVVVNGKRVRPPKYYDSQFEILYPTDFALIKDKRVRNAKRFTNDNTPERLAVRRKCKEAQVKLLVRNVDEAI